MARRTAITAERLRAILHYDPQTGEFRWRAHRKGCSAGATAGAAHPKGYWHINVDGVQYLAHRLAWFYATGDWVDYIDHKDNNKRNNQFDNLRPCTHSQNHANKRRLRTSRSGFKGVSWDRKRGMWRARIKVLGEEKWLGNFQSPKDAHVAYCKAAIEYFGEFARFC